ncbi:fermentation-respiration switch protein FrsA (DUF1100 family) [Dysgonomonas sp. PH5-45]|uniref:alpha/beta hydrolase family protein n=1 Tax=unclassified Dysgonomonas TaxID=2630389 RepID=UPI002474BCBE|nr:MULTISPECIES: alpha/beta hydrolase [unclassified Dysgonomonas]MDH6354442.1 fermentation-respiration switch protein FrsA (DUF1100 family) [Dysgonomonas sp. PH5-45]MDH6387341.1 fermentation-respiration switch protein FrsA (DUF1100 family) [Dysgonomonas sp. PH5-37]
MKKFFIFLSMFFLLPFSFVLAQDVVGTWSGKLALPNGSLTVVFHIVKTNDGYSATFDSPDQGAKGIPTGATNFQGNILTIEMPNVGASYTGELKDDGKLYGIFTQGMDMPLDMVKGETEQPKRPQEPKAPFPYKTEDVKFGNENADITLAGTLTMPAERKNFPAVVLVTGSGAQNRNEEIMGHKPFLVIADYLTRNGIAVLRFDDRGVGESEGDFGSALTDDFATDAAAALSYLKTRKDINPRKIGMLGHSEGGSVAFKQAAANKDVAYIISLAGPGVKGDSLILKQAEAIVKAGGVTDFQWKFQEPILRNRYALLTQDKSLDELKKELYADITKTIPPDMLKDENLKKKIETEMRPMTSPWYIAFLKYDPASDLKKIKCPVLALNGDKDLQVPADMNLTAIETILKNNGNKNVTVKKYAGLNHLFQQCQTGQISEYNQIEETINPQVLQDITDWILQVTK